MAVVAVVALLCGAMLALSGTVLQGLTRNGLARADMIVNLGLSPDETAAFLTDPLVQTVPAVAEGWVVLIEQGPVAQAIAIMSPQHYDVVRPLAVQAADLARGGGRNDPRHGVGLAALARCGAGVSIDHRPSPWPEVPAAPQRIVTRWDGFVTVLLLELGVTPVGSQGRQGRLGLCPGVRILNGTDFSDGPLTWVGNWSVAIERIAALAHDLIITAPRMKIDPEALKAIVPTISLDPSNQPMAESFVERAELTGTEGQLARLQAAHAAQIDRLHATILLDLTVSTVFFLPRPGEVFADPGNGAVARILAKSGLAQLMGITGFDRADQTFPAEPLPALDTDVILSVHYSDAGAVPADDLVSAEATLPGLSDLMAACRNGPMYLVLIEET